MIRALQRWWVSPLILCTSFCVGLLASEQYMSFSRGVYFPVLSLSCRRVSVGCTGLQCLNCCICSSAHVISRGSCTLWLDGMMMCVVADRYLDGFLSFSCQTTGAEALACNVRLRCKICSNFFFPWRKQTRWYLI